MTPTTNLRSFAGRRVDSQAATSQLPSLMPVPASISRSPVRVSGPIARVARTDRSLEVEERQAGRGRDRAVIGLDQPVAGTDRAKPEATRGEKGMDPVGELAGSFLSRDRAGGEPRNRASIRTGSRGFDLDASHPWFANRSGAYQCGDSTLGRMPCQTRPRRRRFSEAR